MHKKSGWLNKPFFLGRGLFYLALWALIGWRYFGFSVDQDKSKNLDLTVKAQRFAPVSMIAYGLTLTFAAFDWLMSLQPAWQSTIFGVTIFAGCVVTMFSTLIVVTMSLKDAGLLATTTEHYHDLGKLLFGFLIFLGLRVLRAVHAHLVRGAARRDAVLPRALGRRAVGSRSARLIILPALHRAVLPHLVAEREAPAARFPSPRRDLRPLHARRRDLLARDAELREDETEITFSP